MARDQKTASSEREFEKRFFAEATNQLFCKTFLENALRDPVSGEIGKSIVFAVSQNHAAKLAADPESVGRPACSPANTSPTSPFR